MDWFKNRFAESYGGGSSSGDFLGTEDGSETNQNELNTTEVSSGNGQGNVPAYGDLNHPVTPDGENSLNSDMTNQGMSEHEPGDTDKFVTQPFGEQMVDDNHANVSASLISIMRKAKLGEEADFFTSGTTGVADSPQIMDRNNGGHAEEELQTADNGVESTNNNYTGTEGHTFGDPSVVDQEQTAFQNSHPSTPDINKGRLAHLKWRPSFVTRGVRTAGYSWGDDSNVKDVMHPDEESNIISNKNEDHGNKDQSSDDNQQNAPLQDDVTPDSKYFSGLNNTASLKDLPDENGFLSEDHHPWLNHPDTLAGQVDLLPISWVKQFQNNKVQPEHVKKLAKSIAEEGLREPIQLGIGRNDRTITLGDGNHRTFACEMNGMTHIPVHGYSYKKRNGGIVHDKMSRVTENFPKYFAPREALDEFSDLKPPKKSRSASLLSIIMKKTADAAGLMPSVNPNSGRDENDDEEHKGMGDGKESYIGDNVADKDFLDPAVYRQKHIYYGPDDRAGDDTGNYYQNFNSGGGGGMMGLEGDGQNSSGVDNT